MSQFRTLELSDSTYENDGLKFLTLKSKHLKGRGNICLFLPEIAKEYSSLPIYILLHGVYGSAWSWALKGGAHITAKRMMNNGSMKPAIIAMPSDGLWGDGSAYLPHHERDFGEWIVSDVPNAIKELVPQANEESPLCIAGLSMGGFGALHLGASNASKITAISAHSSITCFKDLADFIEEPLDSFDLKNDKFDLIDVFLKHESNLPPLRFDCGKQDPLLEANRKLHLELKENNIPHIYQEFEGGHEWPYWKIHIKETFLFFDAHIP